MPVFSNFLRSFFIAFLICSCSPEEKVEEKKAQEMQFDERGTREQFMQANRQLIKKENDEMDYYVRSRKMPFVKTLSGIRYFVYKPSERGDSIKPGMRITMSYEVRLLDGTLCYSSEENGKRTFLVSQEEIESGIHKGVQYLKKGDQAILLIPSHLAHGLLGDRNKIPPQTPIVYDIKINND